MINKRFIQPFNLVCIKGSIKYSKVIFLCIVPYTSSVNKPISFFDTASFLIASLSCRLLYASPVSTSSNIVKATYLTLLFIILILSHQFWIVIRLYNHVFLHVFYLLIVFQLKQRHLRNQSQQSLHL